MDEITVDSNVPLPTGIRTRRQRYPWNNMNIGDSFIFPMHPKGLRETQKIATRIAWYRSQKYGTRFVSRQILEKDEYVIRVWRIE